MISERTAFLLPVLIDGTRDSDADVPAEFRAVQWTRAPEGALSPVFVDRVKALLDGGGVARAVPVRRAYGPELVEGERVEKGENAQGKARTTSASRHVRRWLAPAIAGLAVLGALAIWQPWEEGPPSAARASAPLTEARQLTLKARALIDDDFLAVRENFRLADELCEKAVKLAPDDGEAWATWARVSSEMQRRRYDTSTTRTAAARSQAERAIRLAPDSVEARARAGAHPPWHP
jgi:tetratricopeptide (TPR) repeat protein